MKVYFNKSHKVMEKWPDEYWEELGRKLVAAGHTLSENPDEADTYVGPPGYDFNGDKVLLLGPTLKYDGVKSPIVCSGCLDKLDPKPMDCFFSDELCMREITPNDVLGVLCG